MSTEDKQLTKEQKALKRRQYQRDYYDQKKNDYSTRYQRKAEADYFCEPCNCNIKLVSKAAHEGTNKHLFQSWHISRRRKSIARCPIA